MKPFPLILAILCGVAFAKDGSRITYVGDGRYTCSGDLAACAQIEASNRQREQQRQFEYERKRYEMERYIRENREREQELRNR